MVLTHWKAEKAPGNLHHFYEITKTILDGSMLVSQSPPLTPLNTIISLLQRVDVVRPKHCESCFFSVIPNVCTYTCHAHYIQTNIQGQV